METRGAQPSKGRRKSGQDEARTRERGKARRQPQSKGDRKRERKASLSRVGSPRAAESASEEEEEAQAAEFEQGEAASGPTTHRLRSRYAFWLGFTTSTLVLSWLTAGVKLEWGPLGPAPEMAAQNHPSTQQHASFVDEALAALLTKGAIAVATTIPVVINPLKVIERRGKLRLVLDLRHVNEFCAPAPKFKYESIKSAADVCQPGDWLFPIDLESAYHHVPMHHSAWRYLGLRWRGVTYVFKVLPFGLSCACWVFTKLTNELAGYWRRQGIRLLHYLDDFCFAERPDAQGGPGLCARLRARVLSDINKAGFSVQVQKLHPPAQRVTFLGFQIDTVAGKIYASAARAQELAAAVRAALGAGAQVPARQLAGITGRIASLLPALGNAGRIFTRGLNDCLPVTRRGWRRPVALTVDARQDLIFWRDRFSDADGQPLWPSSRVDTIFYSDAGAHGWGGWTVRPDGGTEDARGYLDKAQQVASSTLREAIALWNNLTSLPGLAGRRLRAVVDNSGLEWGWAGGSRTPEINSIFRNIWEWCRLTGSSLAIYWVPRRFNVRADQLSKFVDRNDWQLHPECFRMLDSRWGPHTFDRFATDRNALCARFCSAVWCPGTQGIDAFSFDWRNENNWANPPFVLIPKVIQHLRLCEAAATLICPAWYKQPWWHVICPDGATLAPYIVDWVELPSRPDLFRPGPYQANQAGVGNPKWRVLALRIDFTLGARPSAAQMKRRRLF